VKYLFKTLEIKRYFIFEGKDKKRMQVFIEVPNISLEEAHRRLEEISLALNQKMVKRWKCLPSLDLPDAYNIVTLPYNPLK